MTRDPRERFADMLAAIDRFRLPVRGGIPVPAQAASRMLNLSTTLLAGAPGKGTTSTAGPGSGFAGTITVRNYVKWAPSSQALISQHPQLSPR